MKAKDIEAIRIAGQKLRNAIRAETGPTQLPPNDDAVCDAINAIIDAVLNELCVNLYRGDRPS